jgi:hypothetical protein
MPEERIVYGCPGADRPEALPFTKEVDGSLYYTCPECTEQLAVAMAEWDTA